MLKVIILIVIGVCVLSSLLEFANKHPGLMMLLAIPIAILTVPFKLAAMMGGGRRRR